MKTYLGEDPDTSEAIEFLCLAEGGEVTHYETLSAMTKGMKNRKTYFESKSYSCRGEKASTAMY
jgi:hypothetical protein